ncbi:MAG: hypothetical protein Q9P14_17900 [candidate division KSB1 bacterium]|nr:hypothetical protein [candidate division KSB1 bacterium]MDQ7065957.1 hypothetical protein [candidate division KSB1 bacterium]
MAWSRFSIILLLISLFLGAGMAPLYAQDGQDKNGKSGKLGRLGKDMKDDNEDDEEKKGKSGKLGRLGNELKDEDDHDGGGGFGIWTFLDPADIVNALANMKPGPYPYNPVTHSLLPDSLLPGGMMQIQASYFQNSADVYGFHWRFLYEKSRFFFDADAFNLFEQVDDALNQVDLLSMHLGWDFLNRRDFVLGGKIGFRSLYFPEAVAGPELGVKLVALPGRPLLLEADGTIALINEKAFSTFAATLGLMIWRFEVLFGGQIFKSPSVTIDGWKLGFRFWF